MPSFSVFTKKYKTQRLNYVTGGNNLIQICQKKKKESRVLLLKWMHHMAIN